MKKFKRSIALILSVLMLVSLASGCGNKEPASTEGDTTKITYWRPLSGASASLFKNFGETPFARELQKITGVEVEYTHPPQGQDTEKFSVLISSRDMPDIIEYKWMLYPGGPAKALKDGVIIGLNEYEKHAPNLFKYFKENEDIRNLSSDDDGNVFAFPFIRGDESLCVSAGLVVRYDWLEELGLKVPETMDEWESVLRAFKERKGAAAPLTVSGDTFYLEAAYGLNEGFYHDNQVVKFGQAEPGYKDFLTKMAKWYKEGLLDNNFTTLDGTTKDYNILNGVSGATIGAVGGGIGKWMSAATQEGFSIGPAPFPVLSKGDYPEYSYKELRVQGTFAAVTSSAKNIEAVMKFLDAPYEYGSKAYMLYNFGIEGESYNMVDGYPTFTEDIKNNPDGLSMQEALSKYTLSYSSGPFLQDKRYMEQYGALPVQQKAVELWSDNNGSAHKLPYTYPKADELSENARLTSDITTYASEMKFRFIMGVEPIENFDAFVKELNNRGLDRLLKIKQDALDRYNKK